MLAELRDARAVKAILGRDARVASSRELQRRRNRRSVAVELADGSRVVVKYYWRAELVEEEALRLAAANALASIDTPRLRGRTRHHLVQDFVPGIGLDALANGSPPETRLAYFARAARVLAAIHGCKSAVLGGVPLAEPCAPARLDARMRRAWSEIEARGFPRWEAQQGSVPEVWRRAFDEQRIAKLVGELGSTGAACVLGHGDFQPRHLLFTPDDRLFVVDWIAMSRVTPWIELAHLLRWLAPAQHASVTETYLEAMQRQGLLRDVSPARGAALAASALLYDHLIVARHCVRRLAAPGQPGRAELFRACLDALAEGRV
jgi:aminoglycoside phosphotransferase (APT) family kinase protein